MTLDRALNTVRDRVIRAALACLNKEGWLFDVNSRVHNPEKARKLEDALAVYKEALKAAKKRRRK